jgi:tryptophan 2,3-dioxygenase
MEITQELKDKLEKLQEKYLAIGQDLNAYLDGLLYADSVKYWEYIQLDSLLGLQNPRTSFPDEKIFIMYHQITELYFNLALHEFEQIGNHPAITGQFFLDRVTRINRYFEALTHSFQIMIDGMEKEQFLKFRMSLLPASGFQSAQYRKIEIYSTDFINLVHKDVREKFSNSSEIEALFEHIYWKEGATEIATGIKTLTLIEFEQKYKAEFIALGKANQTRNLWQAYLRLSPEEQQDPKIIQALRQNDVNVNINWPLAHYKSAVRYLQMKSSDIPATGGTNWQHYLPPRFQKRIFYPSIWSEEEIAVWGKSWVENVLEGK